MERQREGADLPCSAAIDTSLSHLTPPFVGVHSCYFHITFYDINQLSLEVWGHPHNLSIHCIYKVCRIYV